MGPQAKKVDARRSGRAIRAEAMKLPATDRLVNRRIGCCIDNALASDMRIQLRKIVKMAERKAAWMAWDIARLGSSNDLQRSECMEAKYGPIPKSRKP